MNIEFSILVIGLAALGILAGCAASDGGPQASLAMSQIQNSSANKETVHQSLVTISQGSELDELLTQDQSVTLLDFYADWCPPCRSQSKVLHELEQFASENNALIVKVNVDSHPGIAKQYNVMSLPTLALLKHGKVIERKVGLQNERVIRDWLGR